MPSAFTTAEEASRRGQTRFKRAMMVALVLLVVAAAAGLVHESWAGWVSGAAFAGSILATGLGFFRDAEDDWYDGRAVAESAKTLTWKYAVGGEPFEVMEPDAQTAYDRALAAVVKEIHTLRGSVAAPARTSESEKLRLLREEPLEARREVYREQRLKDQRDWYGRRGGEHRSTARTWQVLAVVLQVAGLVGALLKGADIVQVDLLSVFATAGAGAVAWLAAGDYVKTARAYELTTLELNRVLGIVNSIGEEAAWATFVADAEQAMSREHTAWQARRRGP